MTNRWSARSRRTCLGWLSTASHESFHAWNVKEKGIKARQALVDRIRSAVVQGGVVASLQGGDPMMYGLTLFLEMLPPATGASVAS